MLSFFECSCCSVARPVVLTPSSKFRSAQASMKGQLAATAYFAGLQTSSKPPVNVTQLIAHLSVNIKVRRHQSAPPLSARALARRSSAC